MVHKEVPDSSLTRCDFCLGVVVTRAPGKALCPAVGGTLLLPIQVCIAELPAAGGEQRVFGVSETRPISPDVNGFPSDSPHHRDSTWYRLPTAEFLPSAFPSLHQEVNFLYLFEVISYVKKQ